MCFHKMLCFHAAQTGKHLLRTQNVSEQNQKHFLCPGHKICVRNKCCARGQTGKHLCRQQCVRNNMSSFARTFRTGNFKRHCNFRSELYSMVESEPKDEVATIENLNFERELLCPFWIVK